MREIGGYIGFEEYAGEMLHENAIKLNCGRNALAYLVEAKHIKKIAIPKLMCISCQEILNHYNVKISYYSIGFDFKPENIEFEEDEWIYIVNYYGQISNEDILYLKEKYKNIIVDNVQAYFQMPLEGIDTIYSCRKFFGVADGAILYTDVKLERVLLQDESFERMHFLLGRFERTASEFHLEYVANDELFTKESIKLMSKLTENLLRSINYEEIKKRRTENFTYLHEHLKQKNKLHIVIPEGAFMYPLHMDNGIFIKKQLHQNNIYVPTLWPNILESYEEDSIEYNMAANIVPLPIDQRYDINDMNYLVRNILKFSS